MEWLVLVHILSATIGLGPAFAFPVILRKEKTVVEAIRMTDLVNRLEMFPKIFGTLAVVSGLLLFWLGSYGTLLSCWLGGTLLLYIIAEVVIIGFLAPAAKRLSSVLSKLNEMGESATNEEALMLLGKVRNLHIVAGVITVLIFVLMVVKPV